MDDEGDAKHTLLFVVWHLHALHKLGHRPEEPQAELGERALLVFVCVYVCLCEKEAAAHALIISFLQKAGQQKRISLPGVIKEETGVIVSDTRMCLCLPLAAQTVEPNSTTTTS